MKDFSVSREYNQAGSVGKVLFPNDSLMEDFSISGAHQHMPSATEELSSSKDTMNAMDTVKKFSELREHQRTDFDTPVLFSDDNLVNHHRAMMQNFSDNGMYFESKDYVRPGTMIFVKTINYCSVNKCQVRWCSRIDSDGQETFGIGLQCEV